MDVMTLPNKQRTMMIRLNERVMSGFIVDRRSRP